MNNYSSELSKNEDACPEISKTNYSNCQNEPLASMTNYNTEKNSRRTVIKSILAAIAAMGAQMFGFSQARSMNTAASSGMSPGRDTPILPNPSGILVNSVSDLKSHKTDPKSSGSQNADTPDTRIATVLGYQKKGDGGGGQFYWDASDLSSEVASDPLNGIYIPPNHAPTGKNGAWVRDFKGTLRPEWFGAIADGTDKNTELQAALDFFSTRKKSGEVVFTDLYRSDTGLVQDIDYVSIRRTGPAGIDFSNADDSSPIDCWRMYASEGNRERLATENSSLLIIGPGRNGHARGFVFDGRTGPGRRNKASGLNMKGCVAREFNAGIE